MNMREYIEDYDKQILDDQNYFFIEQQRNLTITIDFSTRFYLLIFSIFNLHISIKRIAHSFK